MNICGLQKLTLLDYPERTACTIFTGGCNFLCPFCHNASLVTAPDMCPTTPEDEVLAYLKKRQGILDGVCITGGEPTLQTDLAAFIEKVKALGYAVKLDTNGSRPAVLKQLLDKQLLDFVAMDIKACPQNYPNVIGLADYNMAPVRESVAMLMAQTAVDYEFRTTVVKGLHTADDFPAIADWLCGAPHYYLQQYVDSGDVISPDGFSAFTKEEMETFLSLVLPKLPNAQLRGV